MDILEAIYTRRSIRKYKKTPVDEKLVTELLKAGMSAPSARGLYPWQFIVIDDRKILSEIPKFHPYSKMLNEAPIAILVCGDKNIQEMEGYLALDCGAVTENILLAANALGLGTVWLGIYPRSERVEGIKKLFNLPDNILPVTLIAAGYADEVKPPVNRFNPDLVHKNKF